MISLIWRRRLHCWIRLKFRPMRAVSLPYLISYISIFEIKIYKYVNLDQMDKCYTSLTFLHWFWQYWPHTSYISSHHVSKYLSNIWLNKMKWIVLFFLSNISTSNVFFDWMISILSICGRLENMHIFETGGDRWLLQMYLSRKMNTWKKLKKRRFFTPRLYIYYSIVKHSWLSPFSAEYRTIIKDVWQLI